MQAAVALLAVSLNLFPNELYLQKGGRGLVKDWWCCLTWYLYVTWHATCMPGAGLLSCRSGLGRKPQNFECWLNMLSESRRELRKQGGVCACVGVLLHMYMYMYMSIYVFQLQCRNPKIRVLKNIVAHGRGLAVMADLEMNPMTPDEKQKQEMACLFLFHVHSCLTLCHLICLVGVCLVVVKIGSSCPL